MKGKVRKWLVGALTALAVQWPAAAEEQPVQPQASELALPADPGPQQVPEQDGVRYREYRVGGRLERVTVTRENGFTEVYENHRKDSVWSAQENEIGEVPNMRQWIIRSW